MFIGREKELEKLNNEFKSNRNSIILVYGKRRIGKSTLICSAASKFEGTVINHQCIRSSYRGNVDYIAKSVCNMLELPEMRFSGIEDIFAFLGKQPQKILLILDEYQYLKTSLKSNELDSILQSIVDKIPSNVKLVLCGSYISVMKELLTEGNPLFGRFTTILHVKEMDYLDAAKFLEGYSDKDKIKAYTIFGGSPYVVSVVDTRISIEENIKKYLLPENSILSTYIENVLLSEIKNTFDIRILEIIGNGKKKYSEILSSLNMLDNGGLDKQLNYLLDMETISKNYPINKKNDKKKSFYEINDNLMRFYFAMIFGNTGVISLLGEDNYYDKYIDSKINTFVSLRFEDVVKQYFIREVKSGRLKDVLNIGVLWYVNPKEKTNGQFDCVIEYSTYYEVIEVKYYDKPMELAECKLEIEQVKNIPGFSDVKIGFVCTAGFDERLDGVRYVTVKEIMDSGNC